MKTVLIILSAGRCGSTNLINKLNQEEGINIYGENFGAFLDLTKSAYYFDLYKKRFIDNQLSRKQKNQIPFFGDDVLISQVNHTNMYVGNEFYNNHTVLGNTLDSLNNTIVNFFKGEDSIVGFKEIRWANYSNLIWLNHLSKLPFKEIKFIKLNRNIEDQAQSMDRSFNSRGEENPTNFQEALERIKKCNRNIDSYLRKVKKDKKYECNYIEDSEFHLSNILKWLKN